MSRCRETKANGEPCKAPATASLRAARRWNVIKVTWEYIGGFGAWAGAAQALYSYSWQVLGPLFARRVWCVRVVWVVGRGVGYPYADAHM
jgi:hypothetical protein